MKNNNELSDETKNGNLDKPMLANRYFIVFFIANMDNQKATGYDHFTTYNGEYLNRINVLNQLQEKNKRLSYFTITNIIELSKTDFKFWDL
jgi:hypothetical protein